MTTDELAYRLAIDIWAGRVSEEQAVTEASKWSDKTPEECRRIARTLIKRGRKYDTWDGLTPHA